MHRINFVSTICLIATLLISANGFAGKKQTFSVEDLYKIKRISQLEVSPDKNLAAFAVKTFDMATNKAVAHLWVADLAKKTSKQLTTADQSDWAPRWLPDGRLAFLSMRSGSPQIWAIHLDGGEALQLTRLPLGINNFTVAPDGKHVAAIISVFPQCKTMKCNEEKAKEKKDSKVKALVINNLLYRIWDHWLDETRNHVLWVPLNGDEPRDLTPGNYHTPPLDLGGTMDLSISPDGKEIAYTSNKTKNPAWNTNNDIFTVLVNGKKTKNITKNDKGADSEPFYSPDGKYIAYLKMKRPGFEADRKMLVLYDRKSKKKTVITKTLDRSIYSYHFAHDSESIVFYGADNGRVAIWQVTLPQKNRAYKIVKLVKNGTNKSSQFTYNDKKLVYLKQSMQNPTEVFMADANGQNPVQISHINDKLINKIEMGKYQDIEYKGANGDKIHGFLLKPPGFNPKKKYPVLMLIHGGPQGAFGDSFHPRWNMQMFASPGFVVVAVNFHGSKGYGQQFCDSISGDWGGKPYEDIMKGVDYITKNFSFIDKNNISAAGASYGGFMINWILGHTDRFRSLVSHDGVFEQKSMYGATEELWFQEWEYKGTPWSNPDLYNKYNPFDHAKNFKTPTLVIHGEHDYRVPYTQGMQLFTALQRMGVESRFLFFPDENHFVQKPQNARLWWNEVLGWVASHAGLKWTPPGKKKASKANEKTADR